MKKTTLFSLLITYLIILSFILYLESRVDALEKEVKTHRETARDCLNLIRPQYDLLHKTKAGGG